MNPLRAIRDRADLLALAALLVAIPLLPGATPGGVLGLGIGSGSALLLHAVGLVLLYRSNRIINFAQVQVGIVAGVLFRLLVEQRTILRALRAACAPCVPRETAYAVSFTYWLALILSIGVAALLSMVIYRFVIRRFADAPRSVLTVATIGIAQLLASVQAGLPGLLATEEQSRLSQLPIGPAAPPPLRWSLRWEPAFFRAPEILTVVIAIAAVIGLVLYFRRGTSGVAIRAAAENRDRAATLGIDVDRTTQRVWVIAGLLSGTAGLLAAMASPMAVASSLDISVTVRILAAAVMASMTSIPIAAAAAMVLGVFDQAMLWAFKSSAPVDGLMMAIIAGVLLLQRSRASRVETELAGGWRAAREVRPIPTELRSLRSVRGAVRGSAIAVAVLVLAGPFVMSPSQVNITTITLIYAIVGMSLLILSGWAGQISLGQFAFAAVGGFVAAVLSADVGVPMILSLIVAAIAGAIVAVVVGIPALKMRGLNLAITTLAVALTTTAVVLNPTYLGSLLPDNVARGSLIGISLEGHRPFYYFTLTVLALVVGATMGLRRSRIGRALIASRDNESAAQSFGIAPVRARLSAFAISGAFAALAGGLFVFHQFGLKPASFTPDVSVLMFLMAVIGGLGSIAGPLLGAAALGTLALFSAGPFVTFLATGGGLVVLLLLAPGGLVQIAADARDGWLRRVAKRHHIVVPSLLADAARGTTDDRAPLLPGEGDVPVRYRPARVGTGA